jgi:hypothetical protein
MNMYCVYDLPNWLFGLLTIVITVAIGLSGLYATRKWVRRIHGDRHSHNEVVTSYLGAVWKAIAERAKWFGWAVMDHRLGWRFPQYRDHLVLRHEKPEHALMDDGNALCTFRPVDLFVGRMG